MKNLTYKAVENSKNTSGESGNNPAGGSGQLTEAQIRQLVQVAADMGCTHFFTHFFMDTEAEMAATYTGYATNYNLRTMYEDIRLWFDIIHEKGMNVVHRGSWSGVKQNNNFQSVTYGTARFIPKGSSTDAAGSTTYAAKLKRWLDTVGNDHFQDGDIIAPISEATEFLSNSNYYWFDTSAGVTTGFYNFFITMKDTVEAWAAAQTEPKTLGYFTIVNYSEYYNSPGHYLDATLPLDQGFLPIDYYGHNQGTGNGTDASPDRYVIDWTELKAEVDSTGGSGIPIFQTEMGGIFGDSWPTLGRANVARSPRVNSYEESAHYQIKFWQAYRDELVDTDLMNGVSNWGMWSGQNSSIVFYSGGLYKPNYMGQIYANFLKGNGMARIPVPNATTFDSWGGRSNFF